jgi:hypothetical protein
MSVDLQPATVPFSSGINLGSISTSTTLNGGASDPVDYIATSISLASSRTLTFANGYTRLHVTGNISVTGNASIVVNAGSKVEIYVGGTVNLAGNGVANNSGTADKFQVYVIGNGSVSISGNGQLIGVVYAPDSAVSLNGGGSNGTVVGAIVGYTITLDGHMNFHYDEALRKTGPTRGYSVVSWQEQ